MAKKLTGARVEFKKNSKGEFNYKIFGKNGKIVIDCKQGFKRKAGVYKNLASLDEFFHDQFSTQKIFEVK